MRVLGDRGLTMPLLSPPEITRVLLLDDDVKFSQLTQEYIENYAFSLTCAFNAFEGLKLFQSESFDIVLLDMFLPDMHGLQVLKHIRTESKIPVVILSAHNAETDRIVALEMGADDYVAKNSSPRELVARIRAVLRRPSPFGGGKDKLDSPVIRIRELQINTHTREVLLGGAQLELTAMEYRLLLILASEAGRVFSREELLELSGDTEGSKFERSVDSHISSLRNKLGDDSQKPRYIRTLRGIGYSFIK